MTSIQMIKLIHDNQNLFIINGIAHTQREYDLYCRFGIDLIEWNSSTKDAVNNYFCHLDDVVTLPNLIRKAKEALRNG